MVCSVSLFLFGCLLVLCGCLCFLLGFLLNMCGGLFFVVWIGIGVCVVPLFSFGILLFCSLFSVVDWFYIGFGLAFCVFLFGFILVFVRLSLFCVRFSIGCLCYVLLFFG